jgi:hypothetical protein
MEIHFFRANYGIYRKKINGNSWKPIKNYDTSGDYGDLWISWIFMDIMIFFAN